MSYEKSLMRLKTDLEKPCFSYTSTDMATMVYVDTIVKDALIYCLDDTKPHIFHRKK